MSECSYCRRMFESASAADACCRDDDTAYIRAYD